jgi:hypothetical protein
VTEIGSSTLEGWDPATAGQPKAHKHSRSSNRTCLIILASRMVSNLPYQVLTNVKHERSAKRVRFSPAGVQVRRAVHAWR